MKTHYYYRSLRKTIIQFLDIFNNLQIARYTSSGSISKHITVPLKFAGKDKVWHWIHQRKDDEMLPIMSATLTSVDYASDRQTNKLGSIITSTSPSAGTLAQFLNPIPYNLGFTLNLWTLHMSDADQILEQILPFFNPYIMMRIAISELDASFDVKVIFQSCSPDISMEMADEERRIILWNLDFIVHTYLFQPVTDVGIIERIIAKMYITDESWANRDTETMFTSGASGSEEAEAIFIKATQIGGSWYDEDGDPYADYELYGNE